MCACLSALEIQCILTPNFQQSSSLSDDSGINLTLMQILQITKGRSRKECEIFSDIVLTDHGALTADCEIVSSLHISAVC